MKKILLIIFSLTILSGCVEKVTIEGDGRENMEEIIESTKKQEIDLSQYQFHQANMYKKDLATMDLVKDMENELTLQDKIVTSDQPFSFSLYAGSFSERLNVLVLYVYLFNNSEKKIKNINFQVKADFSNIGGSQTELEFNFTEEDLGIIDSKTITPILLGFDDINMTSGKNFYPAEDFKTMKISNIFIEYQKQ